MSPNQIQIFSFLCSVAKFDLVAEGLTSLSHRIFDHPTVDFIQTRLILKDARGQQRRHLRPSASASPAPPFDPSRFSGVLGGVSLLTNQLVLRFEAFEETTRTAGRSHDLDDVENDLAQKRARSANTPSAQLTMSCSELSANFNISSSSSSLSSSDLASTFECLLSFYDLNSSVEYLGRRHQFIGPFHSQVACVVSKGVEVMALGGGECEESRRS